VGSLSSILGPQIIPPSSSTRPSHAHGIDPQVGTVHATSGCTGELGGCNGVVLSLYSCMFSGGVLTVLGTRA